MKTWRGDGVYIIQSTSYPANDNLMELLVLIDVLRRSSAGRITAVIPFFGYASQNRKSAPRTPISAKLVANMITHAGADRVQTMDLHASQIQGFFDIPTDSLYAVPEIVRDIEKQSSRDNVMVVSSDVGGVVRTRALAKRLSTGLAFVDKRRDKPGTSEVMNIIGDVEGKSCVLVDDIVSGGALCNAATALLENGAAEVSAYITHGVLSSKAVERINASDLSSLVITDTICVTEPVTASSSIRTISIAPMFAKAITRIANGESVSISGLSHALARILHKELEKSNNNLPRFQCEARHPALIAVRA